MRKVFVVLGMALVAALTVSSESQPEAASWVDLSGSTLESSPQREAPVAPSDEFVAWRRLFASEIQNVADVCGYSQLDVACDERLCAALFPSGGPVQSATRAARRPMLVVDAAMIWGLKFPYDVSLCFQAGSGLRGESIEVFRGDGEGYCGVHMPVAEWGPDGRFAAGPDCVGCKAELMALQERSKRLCHVLESRADG